MAKNLPAMQEPQVWSLGQEGPLEKGMATYASSLAREFHGQRSLVGYSPCGHKSQTWLNMHHDNLKYLSLNDNGNFINTLWIQN